MRPEPGIYCDVTIAEYDEWEYLRRSHLVLGFKSMLKLKAAWDGAAEPTTPAQRFGIDFHYRLLQPREYDRRYAVMPEFQQDQPGRYKNYRATTEYKAKVAQFEADNPGKEFVSEDQDRRMDAMVRAVMDYPVSKWLKMSGGVECGVVWECLGHRLKMRLDKVVGLEDLDRPLIIDLKKEGRSADERSFQSHLWAYRYDVQAAMALDAVKELTGKDADFLFVVVEDKPPFEVVVYQLDGESTDIARREYRTVLDRIDWCEKQDLWPGLGYDYDRMDYTIQTITLPDWKLKAEERFVDA